SALNWLEKLYVSGDFSLIRTALTADLETADIQTGREIVIAADLVACWLGKAPPESERKSAVEWMQQHSDKLTPDLVELAQRAVTTLKTKSELRDAWKNEDGVVDAEWLDAMSELEQRLES